MELTIIKISRHTWESTGLSMPTLISVLSLPTQLYSISTRKHQFVDHLDGGYVLIFKFVRFDGVKDQLSDFDIDI